MRRPKVSVLIPAYNHAKYIQETIDSVLGQSFGDFELLISDDCSTDNTVDIIKSYSDNRIISVFFKENKGTVRSLNHLLSLAKGEYIAVLGSDDVWEKDKLEKQLEVLEKDKSIAVCFSKATIVDRNSNQIVDKAVFSDEIFEFENCGRAHMLRNLFISGNRLCHSSAMIRTSVHKQVGEYNVAYRQLHDFDLWIRILLNYKIHVIEESLVKYRYVENSGNVSQSTTKNDFRLWNEAEAIITFLFENISDEDFIEGFSEYFTGENIQNSPQIVCEKFFILEKIKLWAKNNTSLAIGYLLKHLNDEVLLCFEKDYGMSLNDIYDYTATFKATYYAEKFSEFNRLTEEYGILRKHCSALEQQINEIHSSSSWRITKPLRTIGEKIRK